MRGMSTAIGKGTTSASESELAAQQDTQRRTSGPDAATRSAKFRAALGDSAEGPPNSRFGVERQARGKEGQPGKSGTPGKDAMAAKTGATASSARPESAGRGGVEGKEDKTDKATRPPGLTDEQAMVLGAMGEGATGASGKKTGQAAALSAGLAEDPSLAAGVPGGPLAAKASTGKGGSSGEELIAEVAAALSVAAQLSPAQGWSRPEGPTRPDRPARELPQPLPGVDPIHQLLIGKGPNGAEARMRISVGPLAGTEIHLREGPGGIQASILTQNASSRQTLSSAMEAVAQRLKDKGHRLEVRMDGRTDGRPSDAQSAFDHGHGRGR
jgi:hypothetical protein